MLLLPLYLIFMDLCFFILLYLSEANQKPNFSCVSIYFLILNYAVFALKNCSYTAMQCTIFKFSISYLICQTSWNVLQLYFYTQAFVYNLLIFTLNIY